MTYSRSNCIIEALSTIFNLGYNCHCSRNLWASQMSSAEDFLNFTPGFL